MSAPNASWTKWIRASVNNHFDAGKIDYKISFEGSENLLKDKETRAEIRLDGPFCEEISKDVWKIECEINVLILCNKDSVNLYAYEEMIGLFSSLFNESILIKKYGNTVEDNKSLVFCLSKDGKTEISNYGDIGNLGIQQGSIQAKYRVLYSGE